MMRGDYPASIDPRGRYTAMQAAALLGVHRTTIGRWKRAGLIRPRTSKVNGRPRYIGSDLIKLWEWETRY
mgnify:FL=1